MKNWDEQAEQIMVERFGRDTVISLATVKNETPYVRQVNAYYEHGAFYVITSALSGKMQQIRSHGLPFGLAAMSASAFLLLTALPGLVGAYQGLLNEKHCGGSIRPRWLLHGCMNLLTAVLSL